MKRDQILDWMGIVSQIGLLLCFCAAVCLELTGNEELKRIVGISTAVFLTMLVFTFAVYLLEIYRNRRVGNKFIP